MKLILIIAIFTLSVPAVAAQPEPEYENLTSPVDVLASYYNAINRQEYQRAYSYWENPPEPYSDFASGFADTLSVQVIVQPPTRIGAAAGSRYVEIPTVLIAEHQNGEESTYAGCFVTRRSNLQPPDVPEEDLLWQLYNAELELVATDNIPELLEQGCPA